VAGFECSLAASPRGDLVSAVRLALGQYFELSHVELELERLDGYGMGLSS
jgi:hypothetical protein